MNTESYRELYKRELEKLIVEINLYKNENILWLVEKEIKNSAGNLCLHLMGNLNHFIGHILGQSSYERNRELEFSQSEIPRETLVNDITKTIESVDFTLSLISNLDLQNDYPINKFEKNESIEFLLIHLLAHFNYHLGQINYHRRLLDK